MEFCGIRDDRGTESPYFAALHTGYGDIVSYVSYASNTLWAADRDANPDSGNKPWGLYIRIPIIIGAGEWCAVRTLRFLESDGGIFRAELPASLLTRRIVFSHGGDGTAGTGFG